MNKLKKAIHELRSYLGRDTRGLELLAAVEIVANDVRKQASAAQSSAADAVEAKDKALSRLRATEITLTDITSRLQKSEAQVAQLAGDVRHWRSEAASATGELNRIFGTEGGTIEQSNLLDFNALARQMKAVRKWKWFCPKAESGEIFSVGMQVSTKKTKFHLETLISNLSNEQLLALGRFVAVMALMGVPCWIEANKSINAVLSGDAEYDIPCFRDFVRWQRHNFPREASAFGVKLGNVSYVDDRGMYHGTDGVNGYVRGDV